MSDPLIDRELGQYRIVEAIGAGGMGVVYRARDRKLERDVALKMLPAGALADESTRKRFRKEALALSRLSHPHIASLFDFDTSADGIDFLVMELVLGPSLDAKLKRGPLPEREVIRLGAQIARALVAAHEQGIVHRDLKPGNVKLTADGLVKVLDFGLARMAPAISEEATTDTASGHAAGTPPYMSPEQLLGRDVDERTDVYAAGVVLFEMATGCRPFGGASGAQLVAKILNEPMPAVRAVNASVSPQLEFVIQKAAEKDAELRYPSARELLVDLERLVSGAAPSASSEPARPPSADVTREKRRAATGQNGPRLRRNVWFALIASIVLALAMAGTAWLSRPREPRIAATRVLARANVTGLETDGTNVYYTDAPSFQSAFDSLRVVPIAGGQPRAIPLPWKGAVMLRGIARDPPALLLRVGVLERGRLWRVPINEGGPIPIEDVTNSMQVAWNAQGNRLAFVKKENGAQALLVADASGADARIVATLDAGRGGDAITFLSWHPRGDRLRFLLAGEDRWRDLAIAGGEPRKTPFHLDAETWGGGTWTADGSFFLQGSKRGVVGYRESGILTASSAPVPLGGPAYTYLLRATSDGNRLVGFVLRPSAEILRVGANGAGAAPLLGGARAWEVAYSGDGASVAWASADEWPSRLWVRRPGHEPMPLGDVSVDEGGPMSWSRDGRWIAFTSIQGRGLPVAYLSEGPAGSDVRRRLQLASPEDGTVTPLAPDPDGGDQLDPCWSPDGRWLAYGSSSDAGGKYLRRVDLDSRRVTKLEGSEGLWSPKCAADGRILANDWTAQLASGSTTHGSESGGRVFMKLRDPASGRWKPLVVDLPPGLSATVWGLSSVSWSHDGRRVYATEGTKVVQVEVATGRLEKSTDVSGLGVTFWWLGLDPSDTPLVQRDASQRELVVMDLEYR